MRYKNMRQVRKANKNAGYHFFSRDTMKFCNSKIYNYLYDGRYFITGESFEFKGDLSPERYTIREARPDGGIDTVGDFQEYKTLKAAREAVKELY